LLPPSLQDWLPEGHLAYFIGDTIDVFGFRQFSLRGVEKAAAEAC